MDPGGKTFLGIERKEEDVTAPTGQPESDLPDKALAGQPTRGPEAKGGGAAVSEMGLDKGCQLSTCPPAATGAWEYNTHVAVPAPGSSLAGQQPRRRRQPLLLPPLPCSRLWPPGLVALLQAVSLPSSSMSALFLHSPGVAAPTSLGREQPLCVIRLLRDQSPCCNPTLPPRCESLRRRDQVLFIQPPDSAQQGLTRSRQAISVHFSN